ncbi:hypothetical protein ACM0A9_19835 [Mycobacteroides abscessus subsp. abscessus]|nr:hypothetical protein [Mycobacteroides abscessus]
MAAALAEPTWHPSRHRLALDESIARDETRNAAGAHIVLRHGERTLP